MKMDLHNEEPKEYINPEYISLYLQITDDEEYKTRMEELIYKKKNIGPLYLLFLSFSLVSLQFLFFPNM